MPGATSRTSWSMASSALSRRSASRTVPRALTSSPRAWARAMAAVDTPVPPGPGLLRRHAFEELGGEGAGRGPNPDRPKPGGAGWGQAEDDEALARDHGPGAR